MKAIVVTQPGGPEVLKLADAADLGAPGPGQARVQVMFAGINFVDVYMRRGGYGVAMPFTPGREAAGVVEAVGAGVTNVKPGDRVAYTGIPGSYAEASLAPADRLIPLPDDFSFEQGAAFPLQGMTAHYLLHEYRAVKPGDVVLVHAAAGGMGLLLVQWARHLGARVIGTVSTEEKARRAREAGAHDVILYTQEDFPAEIKRLTGGRGADLIIDGVAKTTFAGDLESVATRGHIVVYGSASGPAEPVTPNTLMPRALSVSGGTLVAFIGSREELMRRAGEVIAGIRAGWLKLHIDRILPLEQAAEAHRLLEGRKTSGKLLLAASR